MAVAHKARAMLAGLVKFGEPSSLAGAPCGHVALERDVDLFAGIGDTADDNHVRRFTLATIAAKPSSVDYLLRLADGATPNTHNPRVGQTLVHPDGTFKLDRLVRDNGFTRRFVVV